MKHDNLSCPWTIILISVFVLAHLLQSRQRKNKNNKILPPGPTPLPILGHLHLLGKKPHHDLQNLAKKHGPILFLRFGFIPHIVVSSPEVAELFLKTNDLVFANRPSLEAIKYMSYEQRNISFAPYGTYWRSMRKLCNLEFLSNIKIVSFECMRKAEVDLLIESIMKATRDRISVDVSDKISSLIADMSCRMVFGKKYMDKEFDERGFKAVIQEALQLAATPNIGDYFPYVGVLDLQGLTRRFKSVSKTFDGFLEKIIDEHIRNRSQDKETKDFVDIMLEFMESEEAEFRIDRTHVKANVLDMIVASIDTSATAIEWVLSELLNNPKAMNKVRKELERVVGMNRKVEESDLEKLEYLYMVTKETFRLHPPTPILLPHEAKEDCILNGYHIPQKSRVLINVWAIGRDRNVWKDAEEFIPERFIGNSIDLKGRHFQLLPFGAGRRGCPGMQLGLLMVRLVVAQLVHCFDWELPEGMLPGDLDMTEEIGLATNRANHLIATPTYRLNQTSP